ncbi:MAG: hypothetical protein JWN99_2468 [Ilumatobacteraceae bacterium]|nr:hypothetical protein [Ilumatobacteraceae bacterium]
MTEPFPPADGPVNPPSPVPPAAPGSAWAPPGAPKGPYLPPTGTAPSSTPIDTGATTPFGMPSVDGTATMPMIPVQESPTPRRSKGKTIGALVGVTALVAAGAFAVVSITGNDAAGGAASPTEVGTQLTEALDNEDVLGVIDLLLPGERDTFRDPLIRTVENLKRLEVLSHDASLDGVSGIDIQFSDVKVREVPTNVHDITNIFLSGKSSATIDGDTVPIGDLLLDEVFHGDRPDITNDPESSDFDDVQMTVVQRDGRWYLSAFYSIAEQARGDNDIPETGVQAAGADKPELAVDQMLQAVSDQSIEDLIAVLDPTEAEALQRYAPLFVDDAQSTIDDADVKFSIKDATYTVEGSGDRRTVSIDGLTFTVTDPNGGDDVVIKVADKCVTVTMNGDDTKTCGVGNGDLGDLTDQLDLGDDSGLKDLLDTLGKAFDDYDPSGIGVHQVGGQWYVSPLSTTFDAINDVLDALDRTELTDVIDAFGKLSDLGDIPGIVQGEIDTQTGDSTDTTDPGSTDAGSTDAGSGSTDTIDTIDTTDTTDPGSTDADAGDTALDACYQQTDATAGIQCMQDGIADGTIDADLVNVTFRYPQCGAADAYWSDVYTMPDADFVALVTAASPCFLNLVASGEIDAYMLPSEFLDPACLEGKNWYTAFDDAYNDRFFDCTSAALDALTN